MSGIYIPGMEMPTRTVHFCIHPDGKVFATFDGGWKEYKATKIPPHGRLIDADAFEKRNAYFWNRDFINPKYPDTLADLVNAAPTIIPAEEAE